MTKTKITYLLSRKEAGVINPVHQTTIAALGARKTIIGTLDFSDKLDVLGKKTTFNMAFGAAVIEVEAGYRTRVLKEEGVSYSCFRHVNDLKESY